MVLIRSYSRILVIKGFWFSTTLTYSGDFLLASYGNAFSVFINNQEYFDNKKNSYY